MRVEENGILKGVIGFVSSHHNQSYYIDFYLKDYFECKIIKEFVP